MCPSPPPDPDAWRRRSQLSGPWRPRRLKHPWITAVLVGLLLAFGDIGALLEDDRTPTTSETAPADVPTTEPPNRSPPRTPTPSEPRDAPAQPTTKPPTATPTGVVVPRVIDGDTIDVRGDGRIVPKDTATRVRLLEIDTPERGACFADTARTSAFLPPGSNARAERSVELTDRYLLYVWNDQGVFVNESLVRSGHATAVLFPPNDKHWPAISRAEDAARQAGAGLWTACTVLGLR